jgi:hypothetical protein
LVVDLIDLDGAKRPVRSDVVGPDAGPQPIRAEVDLPDRNDGQPGGSQVGHAGTWGVMAPLDSLHPVLDVDRETRISDPGSWRASGERSAVEDPGQERIPELPARVVLREQALD